MVVGTTDTPDRLRNTLEYIGQWHPELADVIAEHATNGLSSNRAIDEFLMTVTKLVEAKLRKILEEWVAGNVSVVGASHLLSLAIKYGMLKGEEPLFHLMKWYFAEPRNTSHHDFQAHGLTTILGWVTIADLILLKLDQRCKSRTVPLSIATEVNHEKGNLNIDVATAASVKVLDTHSKLEASLRIPAKGRNHIIKTIPLKETASGRWYGQYDLRDIPIGSASLSVRGVDSQGPFFATSGTVVTVTYGLCPHCGAPGKASTQPCASCSRI